MTEPHAPGFHGKAPGRGDFLTRRLPSSMLGVWDSWLQGLIAESRASLGQDWLGAWLSAPVWHFALGPGVAGEAAWLGVLIPSVDRVGRHFPMTILGVCEAAGEAPGAWALRVEALALGALEDEFDPSVLDAALIALGPPGGAPGGRAAALGWRAWSGGLVWQDNATMPAPGCTVWMCRDGADYPASMLAAAGLPAGRDAVSLITGPQHSRRP